MSKVLEIRDLWVAYEPGQWVLQGLQLQLKEAEVLALLGPNGGGKTTLLKTVLGLLRPQRGEVKVFGLPPEGARPLVGYLPQLSPDRGRFPVTVLDVVLMGRYAQVGLLRRPREADLQKAREVLRVLGLEGLQDRPFFSLSGGQRQRVLVARALAAEPRLLLLDEPSTGVDIIAQEDFYQLLGALRDREGLSVLLASHDIGGITALADRVACLNRQLHYYGPPGEALSPQVLERTFGAHMQFLLHDERCLTCRRQDG